MIPLIKICGIREQRHAEIATEAGADFVGFVFVPVRRQVSPDDARQIIEHIRSTTERPPLAVGLFVNEPAARVNEIVEDVGLDLVQFSGDEPPERAGEISVPVMQAVRVEPGASLDDVRARIEERLRYSAAVLIDSHVAGKWGGTGVVGDWDIAAQLASEYPVVLAGGLSPDNVADAADRVQPAVVDVSSGVETDGRKDPDKIRAFITAAKGRQAEFDQDAPATPFLDRVRAIQDERARSRV